MLEELLTAPPAPLSQEFGPLASAVYREKYAWDENEEWADTAWRVTENVLGALDIPMDSKDAQGIYQLIAERKFLPGGRYLYSAGREYHQTQNCVLLRAEDSAVGWADLLYKSALSLMSGAGVGVDYSDIREKGAPVRKTGGTASGPCSLMQAVNENGRQVKNGGNRRAAIWAGLKWSHPDVMEFIRLKDWTPAARAAKVEDENFPLPMELTNISVLLDDEFFEAYHDHNHAKNGLAHKVYRSTVKRMLKTGEPGFSIDVGVNAGETLRNACTEVSSRDDSDICNLGSINLARIQTKEEFRDAVRLGILFLLAGTVYSDVPYAKLDEVRTKNRRLGLGLMGVHEWLLQRGKPYAPDHELATWMAHYMSSTDIAAMLADKYVLTRPVKTRAMAPNGTIGIIGETTTSLEPIFCVAYERRWSKGASWERHFVIDPTAKRLIDNGVDPDSIQDAYSIDVEGRVAFQSWMQQFVDHGISSTINLPAIVTDPFEVKVFGDMLIRYLPRLRGVTVYPDGARSHQPITPVSYADAVAHHAVEDEIEDRCVGGSCSV